MKFSACEQWEKSKGNNRLSAGARLKAHYVANLHTNKLNWERALGENRPHLKFMNVDQVRVWDEITAAGAQKVKVSTNLRRCYSLMSTLR